MKQPMIILKVGALMAVIFCSGLYVGRVTAPTELKEVVVKEQAKPGDDEFLHSRVKMVMRQYVKALNLTVEQQLQLYPIFEEAGVRTIPLPKRSPERLAEFEKLHKKMAPFLTAEQQAEADRIMEAGRAQIESK